MEGFHQRLDDGNHRLFWAGTGSDSSVTHGPLMVRTRALSHDLTGCGNFLCALQCDGIFRDQLKDFIHCLSEWNLCFTAKVNLPFRHTIALRAPSIFGNHEIFNDAPTVS